MPLVTLKEILSPARKGGYAVGGFNFNGYEDAQGMVNGAGEKRSPVILMASLSAVRYIGIRQAAYMVKAMAESVDIPVCLHLDHATDFESIKQAIHAGFSSVMIDASALDYEHNIAASREVVEYAQKYRCSVEAELGRVGGKEDQVAVDDQSAAFTDPATVPRFVAETGIDALAIAFGSVHGFYKSEPNLDFDRLGKILALTDCPLVLHGGTGISEADFRRCVHMGMAKINIGTEFKKAFSDTLRAVCAELPESQFDPKKYMQPVKDISAEIVKGKIAIFGSAGKA